MTMSLRKARRPERSTAELAYYSLSATGFVVMIVST